MSYTLYNESKGTFGPPGHKLRTREKNPLTVNSPVAVPTVAWNGQAKAAPSPSMLLHLARSAGLWEGLEVRLLANAV